MLSVARSYQDGHGDKQADEMERMDLFLSTRTRQLCVTAIRGHSTCDTVVNKEQRSGGGAAFIDLLTGTG